MADSLRKLHALKHLLMEDAYYTQLMRRSPNLTRLLEDVAGSSETEAKEATANAEIEGKGHVKGKDEPRGSGGGGGGDGSDGRNGGGGDGGDDDDSCDDNGDEV